VVRHGDDEKGEQMDELGRRLDRRRFGKVVGGGAISAGLTLAGRSGAFGQVGTPSPVANPSPGASPAADTPVVSGPPLRVAFVYVSPVGDLGWTYAHDQGRLYLEQNVPNVETAYAENIPETPGESERVIRDFAQQGYNLVVTTSFGYMQPTINVAQQFPDTQFIHISGYMTAPNVSTGFGKIEEPRYVSGLVAGRMAPSGKLGYVAAFPIPEVIRGINAFTLGVRRSNPAATVQVVWTNKWYDPPVERAAAEALLDGGAEVLAQHQDTAGPMQAAEAAGKLGVGYNADMAPLAPAAVLTCPIWHWGVYYQMAVEQIRAGTWTSNQYWGGWQDGLVDLSPLGPMVSADVATMAEGEIAKFSGGEQDIFSIFSGPLKDQSGAERVATGTAMTGEEILGMDWFVEGVLGEIPT
jgi:basic membrane protein A and related proteins